jgi:hypothetical protein
MVFLLSVFFSILHGHEGIRLRFHDGNTINGLEFCEKICLGSKARRRFPFFKLFRRQTRDDFKVQTSAANDALHTLHTVNGLDSRQDGSEQFLCLGQGRLVIVRTPFATPFASNGIKFNTFCNFGRHGSAMMMMMMDCRRRQLKEVRKEKRNEFIQGTTSVVSLEEQTTAKKMKGEKKGKDDSNTTGSIFDTYRERIKGEKVRVVVATLFDKKTERRAVAVNNIARLLVVLCEWLVDACCFFSLEMRTRSFFRFFSDLCVRPKRRASVSFVRPF